MFTCYCFIGYDLSHRMELYVEEVCLFWFILKYFAYYLVPQNLKLVGLNKGKSLDCFLLLLVIKVSKRFFYRFLSNLSQIIFASQLYSETCPIYTVILLKTNVKKISIIDMNHKTTITWDIFYFTFTIFFVECQNKS